MASKARPKKSRQAASMYVLRSDPREFERRFYARYDPSFLFTKVLAIKYIIENHEQAEAYIRAHEPTAHPIDAAFVSRMRAELYFTLFHQFEALFALLIAKFQERLHWVYLTEYSTTEIKTRIQDFADGNVSKATDDKVHNDHDFIVHGVYNGLQPKREENQDEWSRNIDDVCWIVRRIAKRFLDGAEHNAYKHGLRVMAGAGAFSVSLTDDSGEQIGPSFDHSSEDTLSFLELKDANEGGTTIYEVMKFVNPDVAFAYMQVMHQILVTIKDTRLARLNDTMPERSLRIVRLDRKQLAEADDDTALRMTV